MTQATATSSSFRLFQKRNIGIPALLIALLAMMILPLPPFILDVLFTFNIAFALVVLLAGIYSAKPLDFAAFPTVLLVATLFRLALNIASTRVVLLHGAHGQDAAGKVIQAFGEVVIGGNFAVGFVVFLILVIINFVVVTKGSSRISEVTARFTLDAMPGKQMAIDADLNAGLVQPEEAKARREQIGEEADFYGSMDGASKFVRGDAIAGVLILVINLLGGMAIGVLQHGLEFTDAMQIYGLLTIGDGLVAQIPSLFLSTAAALMVTRVSTEQELGQQVKGQLFDNPRALLITGAIVLVLGIIPGMPHVAFIGLGTLAAGAAIWIKRHGQAATAEQVAQLPENADAHEKVELGWDDVDTLDLIRLEVGHRLIPLVDKQKSAPLMSKIKGVRKKLSKQMGFLLPTVHVRDNLTLSPDAYQISIKGVPLGNGTLLIDDFLAIAGQQVMGELQGAAVKDPTFGLDAVWIKQEQRDEAQHMGYTVVDTATVLATHMSEILKNHSHELLGHQECQYMIDKISQGSSSLAGSLKEIPFLTSSEVLRELLREGVPITDHQTIFSTLAHVGQKSQDLDTLLASTRIALRRLIAQELVGTALIIPVATLAPELEQILLNSLKQLGSEAFMIEPTLTQTLRSQLTQFVNGQKMKNEPAILLVCAPLRHLFYRLIVSTIDQCHVLCYPEIPENKSIQVMCNIGTHSGE